MAILRDTRYPGHWASRTNQYPQGAFKNKSSPTATDGSYAEQDWLNDWDGFFGSLLTNAGIIPNGVVDSAQSSQYYDALTGLFPLSSSFAGDLSTTGYLQIPVLVSGKSVTVIVNWAAWSGTTSVTQTSGIYEMDSPVVVNWKKQFTTKVMGVFPSVNDSSVNGTKSETVRYWQPTLTSAGLIGSCSNPSTVLSGYVLAIGY